eukprot:15361362-Ditylum_brightwellii.AAC.1
MAPRDFSGSPTAATAVLTMKDPEDMQFIQNSTSLTIETGKDVDEAKMMSQKGSNPVVITDWGYPGHLTK